MEFNKSNFHDVELDWPAMPSQKRTFKLDGHEIGVTDVKVDTNVEGVPLVTITFHANVRGLNQAAADIGAR